MYWNQYILIPVIIGVALGWAGCKINESSVPSLFCSDYSPLAKRKKQLPKKKKKLNKLFWYPIKAF